VDHLNPFVLPVDRPAERTGQVDRYLPDDLTEPRPAVLLVHGGPVHPERPPTPRDWPVYRGYGAAIAARGAVGATVDHPLYDPTRLAQSAEVVSAALEEVRADPRVDPDRIAIWAFSGGGLLLADWLREPPAWLRCIGATYPLLAPFPHWPVEMRFRPVDVVAGWTAAPAVPIVLTRVGREHSSIASTVADFVAATDKIGAPVEIIDVPNGQHGFDYLDHTDESRAAVQRALDTVLAHLRRTG
jgi:acetyl esterase/lipase